MNKKEIDRLKSANILISGGAGFVGSNLAKYLLDIVSNGSLTIIDNLLSSEKFNVPADPRIKFILGSISDDATLNKIKDTYDYVFHLATFHGNQNSICYPLKDHKNNTLTTLKLYEHIKYFKKIKKVVYSSAGCSVAKKTFGRARATTEENPIEINQDSPYSISKIIGEFYSVYYHKMHNLPTVRARFQNVYGPGEVLGAGKWRGTYATVWRNVVPTFMYKAIKGNPLPLENNGVATRDFIYVDDICKGLVLCALKGAPGDVYNLASGKEVSISDLATKINKITNNRAGLEVLPKRPWDNSGKRFASIVKARNDLGFKAETDIDMGLSLTYNWTVKNISKIEKTISKHGNKMFNLLRKNKKQK